MNREIKFRAWFEKEKRMIEVNDLVLSGEKPKGYWKDKGMYGNSTIVMQYTGLTDKEGVEVYEGDICKFYNKHNETWYTRVVRYCPKFACFALYPNMEAVWQYESDWLKISHIEIIGNIYQHPELLNQK